MKARCTLFIVILTAAIFAGACLDNNRPQPTYTNGKPIELPPMNANQSNNAANKATPNPNGLPALFKGEDYSRLRYKMMDAGWSPARSKKGELQCSRGDNALCKQYPEFEDDVSGRPVFRWNRGDKNVLIYTTGDPFVYDSYKADKPPASPSASPATIPANSAKNQPANTNSDDAPDESEDNPESEP